MNASEEEQKKQYAKQDIKALFAGAALIAMWVGLDHFDSSIKTSKSEKFNQNSESGFSIDSTATTSSNASSVPVLRLR